MTFGGTAAPVVSSSQTQIVVNSPAGTAGATVPMVVTVAGQVSNALAYQYVLTTVEAVDNLQSLAGGTASGAGR